MRFPLALLLLAACAPISRGPILSVPAADPPPCTQTTLGFEAGDRPKVGAIVSEVLAGGPAAFAGMQPNDVIVSIDDKPIANSCEVVDAAFGRESCVRVKITLRRGEQTIESILVPDDEVPFFRKGCFASQPTACFRLAWLTWSGSGVEKNRDDALEIYGHACELGSAEACAYQGLYLMRGEGKAADVLRILTRACDLGSGAGCAHLAFMYATGTLVEKDDARATPLYVRSCELGDAPGCYNVGLMYEDGRGVAVDIARATTAYEDACRLGSSTACTNLGVFVEHDNPARAVELYRKGCDGTRCQTANLLGCLNLGRAYRDAIGVARDEKKAADIFQDVCDRERDPEDVDVAQTQARACSLLGALYVTGDGVPVDYPTGLARSIEGCERKDSFGCFNAARIYAHALGVDADFAEAANYYDLACSGGDAEGCYELARLYDAGSGVPKDADRARVFFEKACAGGFAEACATR